jgi:diguanylate cyclase (GGDEF)-like protein/PAS domain S-box-containing protein
MKEMTIALEEYISRTNKQLLTAEMLDMELEQIFSACADPMIVIRTDGTIVRANLQMLAMLNTTTENLIGKACTDFLTPAECTLATTSRTTKQCDIELTNNTGGQSDFIITATRLITLDGTPGTLVQYKDITERKQAEQALEKAHAALEKIAQIDGLTQIPNRRTFDEALLKQWQELSTSAQPLAAIMCDIDFFKKYNDTYGHQQGDSCLISVAQALAAVVPDHTGLAARYGGEEFIFLLPNTSMVNAAQVAETARQAIQDLAIEHSASDIAPHVTLSLGVACIIPNANCSAKELLAAADTALYLSKEHGRNRVTCAQDSTTMD